MFGLDSNGPEGLILLITLVVMVFLYMLPTIVVLNNNEHNNKAGVIILNVLFGFTFIAWVLCLIWACHKSRVFVHDPYNSFQPQPPPQPQAQVEPPLVARSEPARLEPPVVASGNTARWRLQLYQKGKLKNERLLGAKSLTIGRGRGMDIQVDDERVSSAHWRVTATANGVDVEDLKSTNGTWKVGKTKIDRDLAEDGDWYQAGQVQMVLTQEG